jgi:bifunctional DNase/RNase
VEVEMRVRGLMLDPTTNMPIIVLKDVNSDSVLPIWVGVFEANAIALEIEKVAPPRPMTHDLLKNVLLGLGATVERIVVTELRNDTFLAAIFATRDGKPVVIDARPSDAIALAMRADAPIFVEEKVLMTARIAENNSGRITSDDLRRWIEGQSEGEGEDEPGHETSE